MARGINVTMDWSEVSKVGSGEIREAVIEKISNMPERGNKFGSFAIDNMECLTARVFEPENKVYPAKFRVRVTFRKPETPTFEIPFKVLRSIQVLRDMDMDDAADALEVKANAEMERARAEFENGQFWDGEQALEFTGIYDFGGFAIL